MKSTATIMALIIIDVQNIILLKFDYVGRYGRNRW